MKLFSALLFCAFAPFAVAQSAAPAAAPAKPAEVFKSAEIQAALDKVSPDSKAKGSSGSTLGSYGTHSLNLSLRNASGGAEVHRHKDDIFFVTRGSATLITGGVLVDAKEGAGGEIKGSSIAGGVSQKISVGDVVHVPAGTPHQLILAKDEEFGSVVVKITEP